MSVYIYLVSGEISKDIHTWLISKNELLVGRLEIYSTSSSPILIYNSTLQPMQSYTHLLPSPLVQYFIKLVYL